MNHYFQLKIIIVMIFYIGCSEDIPKNFICVIDGEYKTEEDLFDWVHPVIFENLSNTAKRDTLQAFLNNQLVIKEVKSSDMMDDKMILNKLKKWQVDRMIFLLHKKETVDAIMSEERLRDLYKELQNLRNVSFLEIRYGDKLRSKQEAYNLIMEVHNEATPENFDDLAKQYSDHPIQALTGGGLGWIEKYARNEPLLDSAIWSVDVGEISNPFLDNDGYFIVYVKDEKDNPMWSGDFEADCEKLKEFAVWAWKDRFPDYTKKKIDELRSNHNFRIDETGVSRFVDEYKNVFESAEDLRIKNSPAILINQIEDNIILGRYDTRIMDNKWLLDGLFYLNNIVSPRFLNESRFKELITTIATTDLAYNKSLQLGLDKTEEYQKRLRIKQKEIYFDTYISTLAEHHMEQAEEKIIEFYENNKYEKYMTRERVIAQAIRVSDKDLSDQIFTRLQNGENFTELALKYHETNRIFRNKDGTIQAFHRLRYDIWGGGGF